MNENWTINEHDVVVLLRDLPDDDIHAGTKGVAVFVHNDGEAFEVEFANHSGPSRFIVATVLARDLRKAS